MRLKPSLPWRKKSLPNPHQPPGWFTEPDDAHPTTMQCVMFGPKDVIVETVDETTDFSALRGKRPVLWIHLQGYQDLEQIRKLADEFGLHPLSLEDVVNNSTSGKIEEFEDHIYFASVAPNLAGTSFEQVNIFLFQDAVISITPGPDDRFSSMMKRIENNKGRMRKSGPDYFAYALLDNCVDSYFPYLDNLALDLEDLENTIFADPEQVDTIRIHQFRRELLQIRRVLLPMKDAVTEWYREEYQPIHENTFAFLRDLLDHVQQAIELTETYRELATGLIDMHLSMLSTRMNDVMKVLTLIATIFIPLTFIAGIYGMNFDPSISNWNMPEIGWKYGYPAVLLLMLIMALFQIVFFIRKGWLRNIFSSSKKKRRSHGR